MAQTQDDSIAAPTAEDEQPAVETFSLQVVSPSVGISGPLVFPGLPFTTTVKELKEKIRNEIASRPSNEHQRLIHRGRLLARENEMMSEIFGAEMLKSTPSQTLHLVLRPPNSEVPTTQPHPSTTIQANFPRPHSTGPPVQPQQFPPFQTPAAQVNTNGIPLMNPINNGPMPVQNPVQADAWNLIQQLQHNLQQVQQDHQRLQHSLQHNLLTRQIQHHLGAIHQPHMHHFNTPPGTAQFAVPGQVQLPHQALSSTPMRAPSAPPAFQNPSTHHEHSRSPLGSHPTNFVNGQNIPQTGPQGLPQLNMPRPGQTATWTREGTGPNGERYQVTVNQTTAFLPNNDILRGRGMPQPSPMGDMQNTLSMADSAVQRAQQGLPTSPVPNVVTSGASSQATSGHNISRPSSAPSNVAVPPYSASTTTGNLSRIPGAHQAASRSSATTPGPTVFLLSSPSGPRALVLTDTHTYFTPQRPFHYQTSPTPTINPRESSQIRNRRDHAEQHQNHVHNQPQAHGNEDGAGAEAGVGVAVHPANPNAGAVAAQMWPHIWLIIRLLGFIWFFTSGNTSWWRWIMVSGLAFVFFLVNTGILNGLAEQAFGPIRRHLEALLPLAGPEPGAAVADNDPALPPAHGLQPQAGGRAAPLDPAQVARRLLEQRRRADRNWLWTQVRRAEHAMLLFLASLVPGVGERHIAAREAEANALAEAERQRIQAANPAATATEGEAENSQAPEGTNGEAGVPNRTTLYQAETSSAAETSGVDAARDQTQTQPDNVEQAPAEPLIEV